MAKDIITPKFSAFVDKLGNLIFDNTDRFIYFLKNQLADKKVEVVVRERSKKRSLNQNAYYFGVVVRLIAWELGITPAQAHDMLKQEFLTTKVIHGKSGKEFTVTRSTADLSTKDAERFYDEARMWAGQELGIYVPLPNEADFREYE